MTNMGRYNLTLNYLFSRLGSRREAALKEQIRATSYTDYVSTQRAYEIAKRHYLQSLQSLQDNASRAAAWDDIVANHDAAPPRSKRRCALWSRMIEELE